MSKKAVQIAISVLISLAVIAVIFTSVQAAFSSTGSSSGRVFVNAGLMPDLNHVRVAGVEQKVEMQASNYAQPSTLKRGGHGGCESEAWNDLDD